MKGRRLKLLVVTGSYPEMSCGISPYIAEVLGRLVRRDGLDIAVLTSANDRVNIEAVGGVQVLPIIENWSAGKAHDIVSAILDQQPDVVFIQNPTIQYPGFRARVMNRTAKLLKRLSPKTRICVFQHDIAISHPLTRWRYDGLFEAADAIVVSNNRDRQAILARGIDSEKVHKAMFSSYFRPEPRSRDRRESVREAWGIPQEALCLVYFGYVVPGRNIQPLIRAIQMRNERGATTFGIILGGSHREAPDYFDQCRAQAFQLGLEDQIIWTGFANDRQVLDGMQAADLFISLPTRGADMRNTSILTGLLAGLPVITSRNDRYYHDPDLDSFGCQTAAPTDPSSIVKAIDRIAENPPTETILRSNAERLEPERVWQEHIEVLLGAFGI